MAFRPAVQAGRNAPGRGGGQEGFTLVEVMVALSLFAILVLIGVSSTLVGDVLTRDHVANSDKGQQLRSAIKMMADDLVFAHWDSACQLPTTAVPTGNNYIIGVSGYVLPDPPASSDPSIPNDAVWPTGWNQVTGWLRVCVYYGIEGDALVRETYNRTRTERYSRRTVLTGLSSGSKISMNHNTGVATNDHQIQVTLRLKKEITLWGGNTHDEHVEVTTSFFVP